MSMLLEVCIDDAKGLDACVEGGADRIELCSSLALGGLTPSVGLMQLAVQSRVPVFAMIRPRAGNFCFSQQELAVMCDDIVAARELGLAGVVLGAANADHTLDVATLHTLCKAADGMDKTLHRVIDTLARPLLAVDQAIDLGFNQILSSGGKPTVSEGINTLAEMHDRARGRLSIMAGAGLSPAIVGDISQRAKIQMFHASCRRRTNLGEPYHSLGFEAPGFFETDVQLIKEFKRVLALG